ncbi:hypothetical protein [Pontivivens ytuae]|uniref:Uncharacterized protein n=1 Tax=Pontivivens ytuae TaxID=2789856 RepID=A0A7S9LRF8_9RHOB|nr:hypothetical protein [Pontivivens ytuae]QPH53924.1 hypothetical protein I0K15_19475 [Pontivivens ytuae]
MDFSFKYDGRAAAEHHVDMRQLGESLIGLDRIANTGLIALSDYRFPKQRERFPLNIVAEKPQAGSLEIVATLQSVGPVVMPLVHDMFRDRAKAILWDWTSWVFLMAGGRESDAAGHFNKLAELTKEIHQGRFESEQANRDFMLEVLDKVLPATKKAVSPVGYTADELIIPQPDNPSVLTRIDHPTADVIRSGGQLEIGDMATFVVRVDALTRHNRTVRLELEGDEGRYITGFVSDPLFDEVENMYLSALANRGWIAVTAKPGLARDQSVRRLYISDARSE